MRKYLAPFLLLLLVILVFRSWFVPGLLSTFDFLYYSSSMMHQAHLGLYAWDWHIGFDGFALFFSPYSWVFPFIFGPQVIFGKYLGMDWSTIERIAYLYPYVILMISSPIFFTRYLFPKNRFYLLAVLVYSFNTYALLLAGGEIFLALAYALAPIVFTLFVKQVHEQRFRLALITSIVLSLQIMFDPRVTYVTMFAVGLYLLFNYGLQIANRELRVKVLVKELFYILVVPGIIISLLQAFWIIPTILYGKNPVQTLGAAYAATEAAQYFSFAKFENTISLLHPNWPENIFGKVYFMRWEFLFLPVVAFLSLLFITKQNKKEANRILFFALLGLLGAFFAKGVNDPFGGVYLWMFAHFPGFIMFRDPTKFYLLVSLSYSVLIPFTVWKGYEWLKGQNKFSINFKNALFNLQNIFIVLFILFWLITIRQAVFGQLNGMFKSTLVPQEYMTLDTFLSDQSEYFRTLWYPSRQHFGYYSENHPEISAQVLFNIYDDKKLLATFSKPSTERLLEESSIKYVIIPYDSEGEIFLTDRVYDKSKYQKTISNLQKISWLQPVSLPVNCMMQSDCIFGRIAVFAVPHPKDHFWSPSSQLAIHYLYGNPTKYIVSVSNVHKGDRLIFSESYDPHWVATSTLGFEVSSQRFDGKFNSFVMPHDGNYTLTIYYTPQSWVNVGELISVVSFILVIGSLGVIEFKTKDLRFKKK